MIANKFGQQSNVSSINDCCTQYKPVLQNGFIVCSCCGVCSDSRVLATFTERYYDENEKAQKEYREVVGANGVIHAKFDTFGEQFDKMSPYFKARFARLKKIDDCVLDGMTRNLNEALFWFNQYQYRYPITNPIKQEAINSYKILVKTGICRGRSIKELIAGIYYFVLKQNGYAPIPPIFASSLEIEEHILFRAYSNVLRYAKARVGPISSHEYLVGVSSKLGCSLKIENDSIKVAKAISVKQGVSPIGVAGGILYFTAKANKNKITQRQIAQNFGITEVTLRKTIEFLGKNMEKIVRLLEL